jgi:hypothetical protein
MHDELLIFENIGMLQPDLTSGTLDLTSTTRSQGKYTGRGGGDVHSTYR